MIVTIAQIQEATANHFGVTVAALCNRDRHKSITFARHVALYISRTHTASSFPELGRAFGNRDHSTVMSAVTRIALLKDQVPDVHDTITEIEGLLLRRKAS